MNDHQLNHTAQILATMLTFKQPADGILSGYFRKHKKLGRQDRHEIAETAFAALRHYQKILYLLNKPINQPRLCALAALIVGRGMNVSQLMNLDLDEQEQTFIRHVKAQKQEFYQKLSTASELPQWLIEYLRPYETDENIIKIGRSMAHTAPLDIRVNTLKAKRDKVLSQLQQEWHDATATPFAPQGIRLLSKPAINQHPLFLDGTLEVQDEGSQLLAQLVQAKRGELVVDFCAGAGGKTLAIGAQMANKGRIYAFDISEKRLANLKPRMARAGLSNVHPEKISNEYDMRIARLNGKADRVLVDAPCSGLGTLRRNPDLKYRQNPQTISQLIEQQASILQAAAQLVKTGGRLIYATCSILPEENSSQIEQFLRHNPDFEILDCAEILRSQKIDLDTGIYLKLSPAIHHTDGFFAAVMQKQ